MDAPLIHFEVDGVQYQAARLDAMTQLSVYAKLTPLLTSASPLINMVRDRSGLLADAAAKALEEGKDITSAETRQEIAKTLPDIDLSAMEPLAMGLAKMPDDIQRSILRTLLKPVFRVESGDEGDITPIWHKPSDAVVHPEINGMTMLKIAYRVFEENLKGFFGGAAPTFLSGLIK